MLRRPHLAPAFNKPVSHLQLPPAHPGQYAGSLQAYAHTPPLPHSREKYMGFACARASPIVAPQALPCPCCPCNGRATPAPAGVASDDKRAADATDCAVSACVGGRSQWSHLTLRSPLAGVNSPAPQSPFVLHQMPRGWPEWGGASAPHRKVRELSMHACMRDPWNSKGKSHSHPLTVRTSSGSQWSQNCPAALALLPARLAWNPQEPAVKHHARWPPRREQGARQVQPRRVFDLGPGRRQRARS